MQLDRKAGLMLGVTFVLGAVIGAFGLGALRPSPSTPDAGRPPAGSDTAPRGRMEGDTARERRPRDSRFVSEMMRFLAPRDAQQSAVLRPHVLAADSANAKYVKFARDSMTVVMRRMRDALSPLLDADQRDRLNAWVDRPWDDRGRDRRPRARDEAGASPKPPGDPLRKPGTRPPGRESRP